MAGDAQGGDPVLRLGELSSPIAASADVPARPGALAITTLDHVLTDEARGRPIPLRVHLPEGAGPFPLIVFSHGLGGSRLGYGYLGRSWASHGYCVLHPTHLGSDSSILRGAGLGPIRAMHRAMQDPANWQARPRDLSFLLDSLAALEQALPALAGKLDPSRIGAGGHSFGAWTAGALAGAWLRFPGEAAPRSLGDPRARAFVCLSPPGYGDRGLERGAWSDIGRPMLEITGTADIGSFNGEPVEWRLEPFRDLPPGGKWLLVLDGADHLSFAGGTARSPASDAQKALVEAATLAFWDAHVRGDEAALARLEPDALGSHGPGVRVERR